MKTLKHANKLLQFLLRCDNSDDLNGGPGRLYYDGKARNKLKEETVEMLDLFIQQSRSIESRAHHYWSLENNMQGKVNTTASMRSFKVNCFMLVLTLVAVAIAAGGLVTGFFGMNLSSGLENSSSAFIAVLCSLAGFVPSIIILLALVAKCNGIV